MNPLETLRRELEAHTFRIADMIADELKPGVGFAFVVFDIDSFKAKVANPLGSMAFASNANRRDLVKLLRELASKIEGNAS